MNGVKSKELLSLNFQENHSLKISPIGEVIGIDGRVFSIEPNSLLENIKAKNLHIPLDENHSFGAAVGWFDKDSFEIKEDGIYAKLDLNNKGKDLIENKMYRYLSPVYDANGKDIIGLDSVGLVNRPNLLNNALNSKGESMKELEELKKENEALKKELETLKNKEDNNPKVDKEANSTDETLKEFGDKLEKMQNSLTAFFGKSKLEKNSKETNGLSDEQKRTANLLGLSEEEYKKGL